MVVNAAQSLTQVASFLKVQAGKINIGEDATPSRTTNKASSNGYFNILNQLMKESNQNIDGNNLLEKAEIRQWIEYAIVYAVKADLSPNQVLTELNSILATKTYLVAHRLTVADIFLYYVLYNVMEKLQILEKEKYIHLSRWYDNLQQNPQIRQSNKMIDFNTIYLATVVPARH